MGRPLHERVVLARLGGFTLVNFGLFAGLGAAAAAWTVAARMAQVDLPVRAAMPWLTVLVPTLALIGSRLYALGLLEWRDFLEHPWRTLMRTTLAWQGGFVLVTAGVIVLAIGLGADPLLWIDTFAFGVPLGQAFGRIGCHTYGCCFGRPTSSRWSIVVNNPLSKTVWHGHLGGVPLIPAQLYSAAANFALAGGLAVFAATGPYRIGTIAAAYLIVDGLKRFSLELIRGPVPRTGWTPYQKFAVVQAAAGLAVAAVRPMQMASFDVGLSAAVIGVADLAPLFLVTGVLTFLLMGVHRGDPGSLLDDSPASGHGDATQP